MHSKTTLQKALSRSFIFFLSVLCIPCSDFFTTAASAIIIDKIAVTINDTVITQSELDEMKSLQIRISGLPRRDSILEERIDHHLVLQQMKSQPPILITEEEIQTAYETFRIQHGSEEDMLDFLNQIGANRDDLMREIRDQLSIRKFIRDRFRPFVNITIEDAEDYYEKVYKPAAEMLAKVPPPLVEVFGEIQNQLVESRVQDQLGDWLLKLRTTATINIKD